MFIPNPFILPWWVKLCLFLHSLSAHLDFDSEITEIQEPECDHDLGNKAKVIDMLDSVVRVERLKYGTEDGLLDVSKVSLDINSSWPDDTIWYPWS